MKVSRFYVHVYNFFDRNVFVQAVHRAFVFLTPLIIISMFAYALRLFPLDAYQYVLNRSGMGMFLTLFHDVFSGMTQCFSLLVTLLIGLNYDDRTLRHNAHRVLLSVTCVCCFLIFIGAGTGQTEYAYLAYDGMFSSIITCLICCPLFCRLMKWSSSFTDRIFRRIDPLLGASLEVVPAAFCMVLLFAGAQTCFTLFVSDGRCVQRVIADWMFRMYMHFSDYELGEALVFHVLVQILWIFGINSNNLFHRIDTDYYRGLLAGNIGYASRHLEPPHIISSGFNYAFTLFGGSGCVLALLLLILISGRNKTHRAVAKIALLPNLFNISEIMSFGIPIVFNPSFVIPFICCPVVNVLVAYGATKLHLVPVITRYVSWTTPVFLSGYKATGSFSGLALQAFLLLVDCALYYPFLRFDEQFRDTLFRHNTKAIERIVRRNEQLRQKFDSSRLSLKKMPCLVSLISDLQADLRDGRLFLLYQPQFNAADEFMGAEALLRWRHPCAGNIYPPMIVILARLGNFLPELEQFIFTETCSMIRKLEQKTGKGCVKVSANITGSSMEAEGFELMIHRIVAASGIHTDDLWIEITEQDAIESTAELYKLKKRGYRLVIDDFGMGHTSITYLETDLFDAVKLDGSLTRDVLDNMRNREIISSITLLSRKFDMEVVAEFVETEEQRGILALLGCNLFQGYLYSRPITAQELLSRL